MNSLDLRKYLVKSFTSGVAKTAVVTFSTILFLPLIIKNIGMEKYGLISMAMIFGGMVAIADLGLAKTITYLLGMEENRARPEAVLSNGLGINVIVMIIVGLIFFAVKIFEVPIFGVDTNIGVELRSHILFVGYLLICLMLINNFLCAIMEAYYLMHFVNISNALSSVSVNGLILIASLLTNSIELVMMAPVVAYMLVFLYLLPVVLLKTPARLSCPSFGGVKGMLGVSTKFLWHGVVNSITIPLNKWLLVYTTGSSSLVGIFDVAIKISLIASSMLNSIAQPLFGVFSSFSVDRARILGVSIKVSFLLLVMYMVGLAAYFAFGSHIAYLIDSVNDEEIYRVSIFLLMGVAFVPVSEPFYRALLGTAQLRASFLLKLALPLINVSLVFFLADLKGIDRVSLSLSIASFCSALMIVIFGIRLLKRLEVR